MLAPGPGVPARSRLHWRQGLAGTERLPVGPTGTGPEVGDMSLTDLAAAGSAVSGFAILASLLYLSLQLRQTSKNQRALMQQGRVARISSAATAFAAPEIAAAVDRCWDGDADVSTVQLRQFANVCRQFFISAEDSFLQHRDSLLGESAYASLVGSTRAYMASPGFRAMWRLTRGWYEPGFAAFVDGIMQDVPITPYADRLAQWWAAVARERAEAPNASPAPGSD